MKKLFLITSAFLLTTSVYAQTATPSSQQQLNGLKDRLASAATQLQQSQKRAISGTISATSISTMTVATKSNDLKIELTDAITVFETIRGKRTKLTTDQISKGDNVVVFGDYDTNLDILKAKVVFIQDYQPQRISGTITAVSKKEYTVTVATANAQPYIVDFETTTKLFTWDPTSGAQKAGFAKLIPGDTVQVLETPEKTDNRVSAIRILDIGLPAQAGNLSGVTRAPTASPSATPTP